VAKPEGEMDAGTEEENANLADGTRQGKKGRALVKESWRLLFLDSRWKTKGRKVLKIASFRGRDWLAGSLALWL